MNLPLDQLTDRDPALITHVFIHHSVAAPTTDIETLSAEEVQAQGFLCIGYNAYIKSLTSKTWIVQAGRPMNKLPAAQYGMNTEGYAICIGGNYQSNVPGVPTNEVQPEALDQVVKQILLAKPKMPNVKYLVAHSDVARIMAKRGLNPADYSTDCCGDVLYAFLPSLRKSTGLSLPPELL